LRAALAAAGIDTGVYYDPPLHRHPLGEYCRQADSLTAAEQAGAEVLTLPIYAALPEAEARRIGTLVRDFLSAESSIADADARQGGRTY
jgi:dTDP-4-amino-4,6-dideoxygalactose transaminase